MRYVLLFRIEIVYYLHKFFANICHKLSNRHHELFEKIKALEED